jgi:oxygen-independent coproporphyrinogen-3 oxidase
VNAANLPDIPERQIFDLVEKLDTRGPRYTSYPTVPVWRDHFPADAFREALERTASRPDPVAVYLHLPFCKSRCFYCGCNSCITSDEARIHRYVAALHSEMDRVQQVFRGRVRHGQLHLGGGTPTHTPPVLLAGLLDHVLESIPGAANAERSIEVDPRVTTDEHFALLSARGFTRISIGLQDTNPAVQKAIHREYSIEDMREFVRRARDAGFTSVNIDLIYGLPLQTRDSWKATLDAVEALRPDRLACFGYAHLPEKIIHQRAIRDEDLPAPQDRLGMLLDANHFFTTHGYDAIGMDHFALPDDELSIARRSAKLWRNFMGYTTVRGLELVGLGCSAISEFDDLFAQNLSSPESYTAAMTGSGWATHRGHQLDLEDRIRKQIINHLMCNLEIELPAEAAAADDGLRTSLNQAMESLAAFEAEGLLIPRTGGYSITPLGQLFVRNLAMPFDRYLEGQAGVKFSRTV